MKLLYSVALCFFVQANSTPENSDEIEASEKLDFPETIPEDVGRGISNVWIAPKLEELIGISKQDFFNLPEVNTSEGTNKFCFSAAATPVAPNSESLSLVWSRRCKNISVPLANAENLFEIPNLNLQMMLVAYVNGWMSSPEVDYVTDMVYAFDCRTSYNLLVLEPTNFIDNLNTWSAYNAEEVGRQLALGLQKLSEKVQVKKIHLIGNSLGAHTVGYAGRYFTEYTGLKLARITGLDPANICFPEGKSGLQRGDAEIVDIIHTNPGVLGLMEPTGNMDYYPEGFHPIQPGCKNMGCSHGRAYEYFVESIYPGNEYNFLAKYCSSLNDLKNGTCNGNMLPMGLSMHKHLDGKYLFNVNAMKPYGNNYRYQGQEYILCKRIC